MGLFSCADSESAAADLLGVCLVDLGHNLLKCGAVEAVGKDGSPADDETTCGQFFGVTLEHFGLDFVPNGFGFRSGFFCKGFPLLHPDNLGFNFDG